METIDGRLAVIHNVERPSCFMEKYTALTICLAEGVKHESLPKRDFSGHRLKITPPASTRIDDLQTIPSPRTIKVPKNGVVKLKLLPSRFNWQRYVGRNDLYKVELFYNRSNIPLDTWYWDVPPPLYKRSENFTVEDEKVELPFYVHTVTDVSVSDYTIKKGYIETPGLADGDTVKVTFEVGYTLADVTTYQNEILSGDKRGPGYWDPRTWLPYRRIY